MSVSPSVLLSVCFICLPICFVCVVIVLSLCLSICFIFVFCVAVSVAVRCLFLCLSVCLYPSVGFVCLLICLSLCGTVGVCITVCVFVCACVSVEGGVETDLEGQRQLGCRRQSLMPNHVLLLRMMMLVVMMAMLILPSGTFPCISAVGLCPVCLSPSPPDPLWRTFDSGQHPSTVPLGNPSSFQTIISGKLFGQNVSRVQIVPECSARFQLSGGLSWGRVAVAFLASDIIRMT